MVINILKIIRPYKNVNFEEKNQKITKKDICPILPSMHLVR